MRSLAQGAHHGRVHLHSMNYPCIPFTPPPTPVCCSPPLFASIKYPWSLLFFSIPGATCFPHLPLLSQRQLIPSLPPSRARARAPWPHWTPALPLLGANASHRAAPALPCFLSSACSTKPIPFSRHHGHHQAMEAVVAPFCPNLLPVRTSTVLPLPCAASAVRAPRPCWHSIVYGCATPSPLLMPPCLPTLLPTLLHPANAAPRRSVHAVLPCF